MRKFAAVLIVVTLLLTGYSVFESFQQPPDEVSLVHSLILGQYFYALDEGRVGLRRIRFNITTLQEAGALGSYATGETEIDLIEVATTVAGLAHDSTPHVRIVGTLIRPTGGDAIVVVKSHSALSSLSDLRGKTVGVDSLSLTPVILLRELLRQTYGVDYDEVTYVEHPLSALLSALDDREVDAVVVYSAYAYLARAQGGEYQIISSIFEEVKPILGDLPIAAVLVTNRTDLEDRSEVLQGAIGLVKESFTYGLEHRDEISQEMGARLGLQPEIYALTFYNVVPTDIYLNAEDKENILQLLDLAWRQGLIERQTTEDIFFDAR